MASRVSDWQLLHYCSQSLFECRSCLTAQHGSRYSTMDQEKFAEDSLNKIWSDHFNFFKNCLSQNLLSPFLNTFFHITPVYCLREKNHEIKENWKWWKVMVTKTSTKSWCTKDFGNLYVGRCSYMYCHSWKMRSSSLRN